MLPACPSPSIGLWVYWFQCLLFSPRVPYLRDGVTIARSRFVCPRSERRFRLSIWVRSTSQFLTGPPASVCGCLRTLSLRVCCQVVLAVSFTFGFPYLSPGFFTVPCGGSVLPPRPLLGVWGCLSYPALFSAGWGRCLGRWVSFAPCYRRCPISGCTSLWLRVFGDSWFSPLCSPDRRSASRFTYPDLPPVGRLSFRLGDFSFG